MIASPLLSEVTTTRIEAFSDGVLAIVVTLMVLEIKIPALPTDIQNRAAWIALLPLLPKLLAYALSFVMITIFWVNHHQLFHSVRSATSSLLWLNNLWLFFICLLPFPTAFLGEHPKLQATSILFGFELFLCAASFYVMRFYCFKQGLLYSHIDEKVSKHLLRKSLWGPVLYSASIAASFISIYLAYVFFIVTPVIFIRSSLNLHTK